MNHMTKMTRVALIFMTTLLLSLFSFQLSAQTPDTGWMINPQHPPVQTRFVLTGLQDPQAKTVTGKPIGVHRVKVGLLPLLTGKRRKI
jgi:suppressor for copper-sensitivity B